MIARVILSSYFNTSRVPPYALLGSRRGRRSLLTTEPPPGSGTSAGAGRAVVGIPSRSRHLVGGTGVPRGIVGLGAQILRDGDLVIGRRFDTQAPAVQWAELERKPLERHGRVAGRGNEQSENANPPTP